MLSASQAAQRLIEVFPKLDADERRLSISLYRALARGEPVAPPALAEAVEMAPEAVAQRLKAWPGVYYDDAGRVIGYWGLSLRPMRHRLRVADRTLFAWCAWDTLFLPALLGARAEVESACQASGTPVRLAVGTKAIEAAEPAGLQVSFVLPQAEALKSDVISSFCHYVHFFRSARDAAPWLEAHAGALLYPLEDAFEIGRIRNQARYGAMPASQSI